MSDSRIALVVEDDPIARLIVVRSLAALPSTAVIGVGSVAEAREIIDSEQISVAVLDLQLPDGNGLEVLDRLRLQASQPCVVLTSAFLQKFCSQAQIEENVTLMEKPIDPQELQSVIAKQTAPGRPPHHPFSVPEYLQIACMGVHSLELEVLRAGDIVGSILIQDGDIWTASDEQGQGEDAFRRLLGHQHVEVRCCAPGALPESRQINGNWQHLLLDAARISDEQGSSGESNSDDEWGFFDDEPEPVIEEIEIHDDENSIEDSSPKLSFEETMATATQMVIASRLDEALGLYEAALRLRPTSALAANNVSRLRLLGFGS